MNSFKFYINKHSYLTNEIPDISFIPMLMRRKLDNLGKAGLCTLYNAIIPDKEHYLLFASTYGDVERVLKLINQRKEEGEISPTGFSFSVHNATIGLFSLLNGIKTAYNSISAGKNTLEYGILEAILTSKEKPVLFCYTESHGQLRSISFSCSKEALTHNATEITIKIEKNKSNSTFEEFCEFLTGTKSEFNSHLFSLKRN